MHSLFPAHRQGQLVSQFIPRLLLAILFTALLLSLLPFTAQAEHQAAQQVSPEAAYFDDAVFVGDSLTNQIRRFVLDKRAQGVEILGGARFLSAGAYTVNLGSRTWIDTDLPSLSYRGKNVTLSQGLAQMEAKRVYIMLGLADAPGRNVERDMERYAQMVRLIQEAVPGIQIVAMSVTPITKAGHNFNTTQEGINLFNRHLQALCEQLGLTYLDVATPLKNDDGLLIGPYSNDKKVHLNEQGLQVLIDSLYRHARQQLSASNNP